MIRRTLPLLAALALASSAAVAAADDRPPTPEERAQIEEVLRGEGFVRWDEIEWDDDGYWEVDDAIDGEGREWDLKLDASFAVIEREED
jgi:hypothetical protein